MRTKKQIIKRLKDWKILLKAVIELATGTGIYYGSSIKNLKELPGDIKKSKGDPLKLDYGKMQKYFDSKGIGKEQMPIMFILVLITFLMVFVGFIR